MAEVAEVFETIDKTDSIAVSILTGAGRAFAAGADIKEMQPKSFNDMFELNFFAGWDRFAACRKPVIAAVNGFALGGGCELALMCDIVLVSDKAKFGQPEIKLGVTPAWAAHNALPKLSVKPKLWT